MFDLCEVADLGAQFTLHSGDRALELDKLSVQEAGIMFVFGEFQNYITCKGKKTTTYSINLGSYTVTMIKASHA